MLRIEDFKDIIQELSLEETTSLKGGLVILEDIVF